MDDEPIDHLQMFVSHFWEILVADIDRDCLPLSSLGWQRSRQLASDCYHHDTEQTFHNCCPHTGSLLLLPAFFQPILFARNGKPLAIQRYVGAVSQSYVVDLGKAAASQAKPVVVSFAFHTQVPRDGHVVHINVDRPTPGLAVDMRYDETISRLRLMDFASRGDGGHVFGDSGARSKSDKALV